MKIGDLIRRKGTAPPNMVLAVVISVSEWLVEFVWLDDGERDNCAKRLMEVISEGR